jgi:hypothetical protein
MIADLYFIRFRSMVVEDLEMVRLWRNSDTVRAAMLYKNLITAEQQFQTRKQAITLILTLIGSGLVATIYGTLQMFNVFLLL